MKSHPLVFKPYGMHMQCLLRVSVNKVNLLPERIMHGLIGVFRNWSLISWKLDIPTVLLNAFMYAAMKTAIELQTLCFCQLTKALRLLRLFPVLAPWIPRYPVKHIYQIFTWFRKDSQTFSYLGILWVGTSLARICWKAPVVLGCLLWGMTIWNFRLM